MKLAVLGGGGVRMPGFVRAVLASRPDLFDEVRLLEPDGGRRATMGRLCVDAGRRAGMHGAVRVTQDAEEALEGVDAVFSAVRVGGDMGRVFDERIALERGIVGQETVGAGGCAMALRTIPVVLGYCEVMRRVAPEATLINFTNPAGIITEAIATHGGVRVVGICDTPSEMAASLVSFLDAEPGATSVGYLGLNHLGWVTSVRTGGEERIGELLERYEELRHASRQFAWFDAAAVRRLGALPQEYVSYFYDPGRYLGAVAAAATSRGGAVRKLNEELEARVGEAIGDGDLDAAWDRYSESMSIRRGSYMTIEAGEPGGHGGAERASAGAPGLGGYEGVVSAPAGAPGLGGYEGVALRVIQALAGEGDARMVVNTANRGSVSFMDDADIVEVPSVVSPAGIDPLACGQLPRSARGLMLQVKEYECRLVEAAAEGSRELAELALALHPLVPGVTAARALIAGYMGAHGDALAYLR
ncbi:MAG: family 4 glycosyl hydrolase [Acidimicrobiales bacterium]